MIRTRTQMRQASDRRRFAVTQLLVYFGAEARMTTSHQLQGGHAPSYRLGCRRTPTDGSRDEKLIRGRGLNGEAISLETGDAEVMHYLERLFFVIRSMGSVNCEGAGRQVARQEIQ